MRPRSIVHLGAEQAASPEVKKRAGHRYPARAPSSGALCVSALDTLGKPVQHFLLDPSDPALAERYPLGKRSCLLKTGDVLRAVQYELPELALR